MIILILLCSFFTTCLSSIGQENGKYAFYDSICAQLDERERMDYLIELFGEKYKTDKQLILHFSDEIETLVTAHGTEHQIANIYKKIGAAYYNIGKARETKHYVSMAMEKYQALGDTVWELTMWVYLGAAENMAGNYSKALESYLHALELENYYFDSLDFHARRNADYDRHHRDAI